VSYKHDKGSQLGLPLLYLYGCNGSQDVTAGVILTWNFGIFWNFHGQALVLVPRD
jgi:hypothetical protein